MRSDGNKNTFIFLEDGQDDYSLNFLHNIARQYLINPLNPFDLQFWDTPNPHLAYPFDWN